MSKVFIEESTLTSIGDAIREKTGKSDLIEVPNMASEIQSITTGDLSREDFIPDEAFLITGNCAYKFADGGWTWFIKQYGDEIITQNISEGGYMFYLSDKLENIPFDINCRNNTYYDYASIFSNAQGVKTIGKIVNMYPSNMKNMFDNCHNLRYLPEFENLNLSRIQTYAYTNIGSMFRYCHSLREISEDFLKQFYGVWTTASYVIFYEGFNHCDSLDEIKGLNPQTGTMTSNIFSNAFSYCSRVKDITFAVQDDGTPYTANWKKQTINLTGSLGFIQMKSNRSYILDYNSGITADKEVYDDATYQALKNDKDWFTCGDEKNTVYAPYCRYNHDSAVNTINSLPDTSAYLASSGGTNTIQFRGTSGEKTDGGAINTLTAEEIAVAAAKGWTVTLV